MQSGGKAWTSPMRCHGKSGAVTPGWHFDDNFVMKKNPSIARIECIFRFILSDPGRLRSGTSRPFHLTRFPTAWPSW